MVFCGLIAAAAAAPAAADAVGPGARPPGESQPPSQGQDAAPQRGAERVTPQRGMRGMSEGDRGRMSVDERRRLRRDIQDAGRDIYRPGRPAPADRGRAERR